MLEVSNAIRFVEQVGYAAIIVDLFVGEEKVGSVPIASTSTTDQEGSPRYDKHQQRVYTMKSFMDGKITYPQFRELIFK